MNLLLGNKGLRKFRKLWIKLKDLIKPCHRTKTVVKAVCLPKVKYNILFTHKSLPNLSPVTNFDLLSSITYVQQDNIYE